MVLFASYSIILQELLMYAQIFDIIKAHDKLYIIFFVFKCIRKQTNPIQL